MVTLVKGMSLHGSFLVNDFKRHAVFCVVCFALVEKPWIICFLQLLLRRMLGLSIAAMYVLKLNYYNKKKSFFRPYANYFHGLSLLCMFAFTFRIREQEQILLNTIQSMTSAKQQALFFASTTVAHTNENAFLQCFHGPFGF